MPPFTKTIHRPGPSAVTYHIPTSPPSPTHPIPKTTIHLPQNSTWSSGLHFHTTHTEYLHLVRGAIYVSLDGETRILSAAAGGQIDISTGRLIKEGLVVAVPRYARHNWGRADALSKEMRSGRRRSARLDDDGGEEEVVVEEWTDPADMTKPLFFHNLNGIIMATSPSTIPSFLQRLLGDWWISLQLFVVFWELDNWPVFWNLRGILGPWRGWMRGFDGVVEGMVEYMTTFAVLFAAKVVGWVLGVRAVERGRSPVGLWDAYRAQRG